MSLKVGARILAALYFFSCLKKMFIRYCIFRFLRPAVYFAANRPSGRFFTAFRMTINKQIVMLSVSETSPGKAKPADLILL